MYLRVSNQSEEEYAHGLNEVDNFRNRSVPFEAEVANGMAGLREENRGDELKDLCLFRPEINWVEGSDASVDCDPKDACNGIEDGESTYVDERQNE